MLTPQHEQVNGPGSLECRMAPLYRNSGNQPAPLPAVCEPSISGTGLPPDFEKHAELGTSEDHDMAPRPHKIRNRSLGLLPHGRPKNSLRKLSVQARYAARASTKRASCPDRGCWDLDPP